MGLDAYLYRRKKIICPNCGTVVGIEHGDSYANEVCYWRNEHPLHEFIDTMIAPNGYGDNLYGEDLELSADDLRKIRDYIRNYAPEWEQDIKDINSIIAEMEYDPTIYAAYCADW